MEKIKDQIEMSVYEKYPYNNFKTLFYSAKIKVLFKNELHSNY